MYTSLKPAGCQIVQFYGAHKDVIRFCLYNLFHIEPVSIVDRFAVYSETTFFLAFPFGEGGIPKG